MLQLKLKVSTTIQRHQDTHSKCCEVNHENSIYLLKFATENACEVFVMAVDKAIEKEKESKCASAWCMYVSVQVFGVCMYVNYLCLY